eukprot:COSAG05_NODE_1_length_66591_cov_307.301581_43_plen_272_part_00
MLGAPAHGSAGAGGVMAGSGALMPASALEAVEADSGKGAAPPLLECLAAVGVFSTAQLRNAVLTEPWQTKAQTEMDDADAPPSEETLRRLSVPPYSYPAAAFFGADMVDDDDDEEKTVEAGLRGVARPIVLNHCLLSGGCSNRALLGREVLANLLKDIGLDPLHEFSFAPPPSSSPKLIGNSETVEMASRFGAELSGRSKRATVPLPIRCTDVIAQPPPPPLIRVQGSSNNSRDVVEPVRGCSANGGGIAGPAPNADVIRARCTGCAPQGT